MSSTYWVHTCSRLVHQNDRRITHGTEGNRDSPSHTSRVLSNHETTSVKKSNILQSLLNQLVKVSNINSFQSLEQVHMLYSCKLIPKYIKLRDNTHLLSDLG